MVYRKYAQKGKQNMRSADFPRQYENMRKWSDSAPPSKDTKIVPRSYDAEPVSEKMISLRKDVIIEGLDGYKDIEEVKALENDVEKIWYVEEEIAKLKKDGLVNGRFYVDGWFYWLTEEGKKFHEDSIKNK